MEMVGTGKESYQSSQVRLLEMIQHLERMELFLHSEYCPKPTKAVYQLYMLLHMHTRHCIWMFYVERGFDSVDTLCETPDKKSKMVNSLFEAYCRKICSNGNDSYPSPKQIYEKKGRISENFRCFMNLLLKCRKHLTKLCLKSRTSHMVDEESRGKDSQGAKKRTEYDDNTVISLEYCLASILSGLEDIGRCRKYAPPEDGEIGLYREIRKRTTSTLMLLQAKQQWMYMLMDFDKITGQSRGIEPWDSFYYDTRFGLSCSPPEHKLVFALDEFADFSLIVRESKTRFLEINSCFFMEGKSPMGDIHIEGGENNQYLGTICCTKKKRKILLTIGGAEKDATAIEGTEKNAMFNRETSYEMSREKYLQDITHLFKKMEPLMLDNQLQVGELRLCGQIMEHVNSSIMLYCTEKDREGTDLKYKPADGAIDLSVYSATGEPITREQYLMKIVQLVDVLRTCFLGLPPTKQEAVYYSDIKAQLEKTSLFPGATSLGKSSSFVPPVATTSEQLFSLIYSLELILMEGFDDDLREMLNSLYSKLLERDAVVDPLKIVEDYYGKSKLTNRLVSELEEPFLSRLGGLDVLDRLLLILLKMGPLFKLLEDNLLKAHKDMDSLLARGKNDKFASEVSRALEVVLLHLSTPPF